MALLYDSSIRILGRGIALAAPFHKKARLLHRGRKGLISRIERDMQESGFAGSGKSIWIHCASLGEFEQGRPLIEAIRKLYPPGTQRFRPIVVTFFSPSGYEVRKDYRGADHIFYLPPDTPQNARRFIRAVDPGLALFVKYEYWYNYLNVLKQEGIPAYVVSAIFRPGSAFFKRSPWGRFMRRTLSLVTGFFVQNRESAALLDGIGIRENVHITGDTRFDRVADLTQKARLLPGLSVFAQDAPVIVCGSTWPADEALLLGLMKELPGLKFIVAPHEIDRQRIDALIAHSGRRELFYARMEEYDDPLLREAGLLVIDTIGLLSSAYRYGTVAYIGGGFGRGIHNTLEAATWGIPVIFGPRYKAFEEARQQIAGGTACSVASAEELKQVVGEWLSDGGKIAREKGAAAAEYVRLHTGATEKILQHLGLR